MSSTILKIPPTTAMTPRKRIEWIDYAKAFALYLMVVGHHISFLLPGITKWIYSFHMPLFFFFAGVLYTPRSPKETLSVPEFG